MLTQYIKKHEYHEWRIVGTPRVVSRAQRHASRAAPRETKKGQRGVICYSTRRVYYCTTGK